MGAARGRAQRKPLLIFGIAIFAAAAFYLALIVATQADDIFLPGNQLNLPGLNKLPGMGSGDPNAASIEELHRLLNPDNVPEFQSIAATGWGVFDTLKAIAKLVLQELKKGR